MKKVILDYEYLKMKFFKNKKAKATIETIILLVVLLVACIIFRNIQKNIFFYPRNDTSSYEQLQKNSDFEEVNIISDGKNLNGWLYHNNPKWTKSPLVIYFAGNAQNSSNTMAYFLDLWIFDYFEWYNVLMVDYPEYGYSEWTIWEQAMFKAAMAVYEWAVNQPDIDESNIVIMWYSIWTGVATYCASIHKVKGLVLIAPYDQALSLYNNAINIFHGPLKLLAKYKFDSLSYSENIDTEVQVITSYDDEVISYKFSQNLSDNFKNHKDIIILDNNVKHSDYFSQSIVLNTIKDYLSERL